MYNLLNAGFFRLKRDIAFKLFIILSIAIAGFILFYRYHSVSPFVEVSLDAIVNNFIIFIGLFIAIFVSIFVGREYSDGIIRNKIVVGHSRINVYLSKLMITIIASILCELIYIITVLLIGTFMFGKLQMSLFQFIMSILNTFLIIIVFCSIFNFTTILCSEITVSTIINICIIIAMFVIETYIGYIANSNKYITHTYTENGISHIVSQELDPNYPGDKKVKLAKTIQFLNPYGQANKISDLKSLFQMPTYSIIEICIINISGIYLFSKKELK